MSLTLVTNRTEYDVQTANRLKSKYTSGGWGSLTASEKTAFLSGLKGAYNYTDQNRVESAVQTLADALRGAGIYCAVDTKADWTAADFPTPDDMKRLVRNVATIRAALTVWSSTPGVPASMEHLDYQSANDVEAILLDVERLIINMQSNVSTSWATGTAYTGLFAKEAMTI